MVGATNVIVGNAPVELAGVAGGLQFTAMQLGGALGTAVLGAVMSAEIATALPASWHAAHLPALGTAQLAGVKSAVSVGSTASVSGPPGRFPLPPGAQVIEDSTGYGHDSIVFGSVSPSAAASFYATALPRAGYTIVSNSSATGDSWDSFSGTGIWFTGHGYNGQIGALSSFQVPGFSLGGNTVEITLTPQ
jgi:hypothetical protein